MTLQQMTYILALYEEKQFLKASERCFVTQPTLSIQLKKAEEELGNQIFERNTNPLKTTHFGEKLIPVIQDMLNRYNIITKLSNEFKGLKGDVLRIGIIPTVGSFLIPKLYNTLHTKLYDTTVQFIELKTNQLLKNLSDYNLDLVIMAGPYFDLKFKTIKLFEEEILIYCPSLKKTKVSISDLKKIHPWLLNQGNCLRNQMIEFCQIIRNDHNKQIDYQGSNVETLCNMVNISGGYTLLPKYVAVQQRIEYGLHQLFKNGFNPGREIIAVYSNRTIKEDAIKTIISAVKTNFHSPDKEKIEIINWK